MKPNLIEMQRPWLRNSAEVSPKKPRKRPVGRGESKSSVTGSTILLISTDRQLHEHLRNLANNLGHLVVRANGPVGSLAILQVTRPGVVLLDLDLPDHTAWETADALLQCDCCPPVILLTGRTDQFDFQTAIAAGSLVDKSGPPSSLLALVEQTLQRSAVNQAERNAIQRVLIRWLKPCDWLEGTAPAHRFWGINE